MRVIKYLFCYLLFQNLFFGISAQTYIQPSLGIGLSKVSNENNGNSFYPILDKKRNPSFGVGIGLEHFFSSKFSSEAFFRYDHFILSTNGGEGYNSTVRPDGGLFYRDKFVKKQFIFGGSMKFKIADRVQIFGGLSYVQHRKTTVHHNRYQETFGNTAKWRTKRKELGLFTGLSYAVTDHLICSLLAQKIIWQDDNQDYLRLNSVSTLSLQLAYRFKVLDKLKKKSKVDCPKL